MGTVRRVTPLLYCIVCGARAHTALRNAFQEETAAEDDKEVVLLTLRRPLVYCQPVAVDRAILFWLNYKNAYHYWSEKRQDLNTDVLHATQQLFEKVRCCVICIVWFCRSEW